MSIGNSNIIMFDLKIMKEFEFILFDVEILIGIWIFKFYIW